ncbi:MAG: HlyD family secretion protein [Rhodospirillales bacterium]|jgi:membrane fusion protein (multidrug efflux system)|nr:HlyD family secretion protein [Rhodospirillales bacterium]
MAEETNKAKGEEELAPTGADDSGSPEALAIPRAVSPLRPRRKRWLRRTLLLTAPVLVIAVSSYVYMTGGRFVETENAYVKADTVSIAAQVSGPIVDVAIRENARVAKGQILFRIDDRPYRVARVRARAQLQAVGEEIEVLKATYRQKAEEQNLAQTNEAYALRDFERKSTLAKKGIVSEVTLDEVRHAVEVARRRLAVIKQEMAQIRARLGGDPDIQAGRHARSLEAQATLDDAALDLDRAVVRAPFAGVATRIPDLGQHVAAGVAVMSVVASEGIWIEANFKETDLTNVVPGQIARIRVDTYPDRTWHGTVESISQATGAEFSIIPPQNATGNWVKIVQRVPVRITVISNGDDLVLRAGMSTSVAIDTGLKRPLPGFLRSALSWIDVPAVTHAFGVERRR